eukprot:scaffold79182_cov51-Prasinocladus_malaysianus.AAC.8
MVPLIRSQSAWHCKVRCEVVGSRHLKVESLDGVAPCQAAGNGVGRVLGLVFDGIQAGGGEAGGRVGRVAGVAQLWRERDSRDVGAAESCLAF